jgi:predicted O-methyltransferase YrrM
MTTTTDPARIDRAVAAACQVRGWCEPEELRWLATAAANVPPGGIIIEVGSWVGRSTTAMALAMPERAKLLAIDTWLGSPEDVPSAADGTLPTKGTHQLPPAVLWETFKSNLSDQIEENRVIPLRMTSEQAARLFRPGCADLCFIDASHTEAAVRQDIWWWQWVVAPGGVLCGHDFYPDGLVCPGVKAAVDACITPVEFPAGSIWAWTRRSER